jgi:hypothetical protein
LRARTHIAMHESAKEAISQRVPAAGTGTPFTLAQKRNDRITST